MLQRIDLRGVNTSRAVLADRLPRAALNVEKAMEIVAPLIEDVRARGGAALRDLAEKFDHVRPEHLRVPEAELKRAAHLITNVTKVEPALQKRYAESLQSFTRDLTEFLLVEIAPYESALDSALDDAADMVSLITGSQNVSFSLGRAETLLRRLPELKTLDWVCNRLSVPADIRELVVNEYMGTNNEHRKAKKESTTAGISQAQLPELLKLLGLQRRAKRPQPSVQRPPPRTKR